MRNLFKKHGKTIFVILSAMLMITYISPLGRTNTSRNDAVIGRIGDHKFMQHDLDLAKAEVNFMTHQLVILQREPAEPGQQPVGRWVPIIYLLQDTQLIQNLHADARLLMLLNYEASQNGLAATSDEVDQAANSAEFGIAQPDQRVVQIDEDPDNAALGRLTLGSFLSMLNLSTAPAEMMRVSQPQIIDFLSGQYQVLTLRVAGFPASSELASVGKPTEQQLQKQFQGYADVQQPAPVTEQNPFGFGYGYPARVKLQYIEVPHSEIVRSVKSEKSDYDWEEAARAYYLKHPEDFIPLVPTSGPATQAPRVLGPTTQATTRVSTPPAAAAESSTEPVAQAKPRPFDQVRQQAIQRVMAPEVDDLSARIETKVNSILQADWGAFVADRESGATTRPTSVNVPLDSEDYLPAIASRVQTEDGIICTVARFGSLMSTKQLNATKELRGLMGASTTASMDVAGLIEANPPGLEVDQPSEVMHDDSHSAYFVRFAQLRPPEAAGSLGEDDLRTTVAHDWQTAQAFAAANAAAQKLVDAAEKLPKNDLAAAAKSAKIELLTTTPFAIDDDPPPQLDISEPGAEQFRDGVRDLMAKLNQKQPPIGVIAIPADQKVLAAQIMTVRPAISNLGQFFVSQIRGHQFVKSQLTREQSFTDFFDLDHVMTRLHYADLTGRSKAASMPS
jgi:hypothetical protein